mmetsp:Transcript_19055/g.34372  ORF Transcript_19055/g.34372 Transcript_19055/m.34372 type:complete len:84 (-) Transcript_19055:792-1043(-)
MLFVFSPMFNLVPIIRSNGTKTILSHNLRMVAEKVQSNFSIFPNEDDQVTTIVFVKLRSIVLKDYAMKKASMPLEGKYRAPPR